MSCVVAEFNITIHEGTTYDENFRWKVDDVLVSLLGITGTMQVRKKITDETPILDLPFVSDEWVADGASGIYLMDVGVDDRYRIYINNEDSAGICASHRDIIGTYNLFLFKDGEVVLKQYGIANLLAAVKR